jgi:transposase
MDIQVIREKVLEALGSELPQKNPAAAGIIFALLDRNEVLEKQVKVLEGRVRDLEKENSVLRERVRELEVRLNMDSHNSGKPPSSDGFRKPLKSLRKKSGRRPGGQPGRRGTTLEMSTSPDRVVEHKVDSCAICGNSLSAVLPDKVIKRQVFDIPPIKIEVTQHQFEVKSCPCCGTRNEAKSPPEACACVQYGPGIKALVAVMMNYQFIPYGRLGEFFRDITGHTISPGTFNNILKQCYCVLENFEEIVKKDIANSAVVCFDETGLRSEGSLRWLHSASTEKLTCYHVHPKRGYDGMKSAGILPRFNGRAVHDGWKQYGKFSCFHALCNAHHLRELIAVIENEGKLWAGLMKDFLLEVKIAVDNEKSLGIERLDAVRLKGFEKRFEEILLAGFDEYPERCRAPAPSKKRGRKKKPKSLNLLERLWYGMSDVLAFMHDFRVPFDNNLSERDIRMTKVQQKVSGSFRSDEGAEWFCRIRSYISTVRKNNQDVLSAIKNAILGKPFMPKLGTG